MMRLTPFCSRVPSPHTLVFHIQTSPASRNHPPSSSNQSNQVSRNPSRGVYPSMAQDPETQQNLPYKVAKASTALTFGGSVSVLSGLTLTGVIVCLTAVTPLLVIFSPVLVPAAIAMLLLATGFIASGGFGASAALVFYWLHCYVAGKHPVGADMLDQLGAKLAGGARSIKNQAAQSGQHLLGGSQHDD